MPIDFESQLQSILPVAYRMARNLASCPEDAEDLLQDASIQAFRRYETFEHNSNFRAWFMKILLRVHLNRVRDKARHPSIENRDFEDEIEQNYLYHRAKETYGGDPAKMMLSRITSEDIRLALAKLPIEFRTCAVLYFLEEMSYEAIAQTLDCPLNTVRSRLHRSRKLLQKELWELSGNAPEATPKSEAAATKPEAKRKTKWMAKFEAITLNFSLAHLRFGGHLA